MFSNKYRLKKAFADIETHEVFLDKLAKAKEQELGISEKKLEVPLQEKISYVLLFIFLLIEIIFLSKTFYLQIIDGKKLYTAAENNKGNESLIIPERGIIYDINLKKLVSNSPAYDLVCDKRFFSYSSLQAISEINSISEILGLNPMELQKQIENSKSSEIIISEGLDHESLLVLESKIGNLEGCRIVQNTIRNYQYGQILSHILGYMGRINSDEYSNLKGYAINDKIGKLGIEKYYEDYLRGTPGQSRIIKSATGEKEQKETISEPVAGNNLVLNINADLQKKVYEALESSIKNLGSKKGAAVAIDPRTGAVLALVSYPSYDDNLFSGGISSEDYSLIEKEESLFNRAIQAKYPTGSTIKPFEAAGALEENIISPEKKINDIGYIEVKSKYDPNVVWRYGGVTPHGWVDMKEAIAVSSNIYFYTVGGGYEDQQGLGPARIKEYLELFGWGKKTGVDLPNEFEGFIPTPEWKQQNIKESWWDGDTYNLSIGQSYLEVTPLQVAYAYSAIANSGTLYKPQIINKIIESAENNDILLKSFAPEIIRENFIDKENLQIVREGMRDCVQESYGSAYYLNSLPVDVAAKTGTAETGRDGYYNAWISTFAPYENPEIVFVATIENVEGLRSATLPVAYNVLDWYFSR